MNRQPVGRNKLKNASILREYGSIGMGEKTKDYCRLLSRNSRRMVGTMLMARHQKIAKLFDEDFWGTQ